MYVLAILCLLGSCFVYRFWFRAPLKWFSFVSTFVIFNLLAASLNDYISLSL